MTEAAEVTRDEIDLAPFCATEPYRWPLTEPFSIGKYTYATDGHICVRVPRRAGIPRAKHAPDPRPFFLDRADCYSPFPFAVELPAETEETCEECYGRGTEHDCPDCVCRCPNEHCREGKVSSDDRHVSVGIIGVPFSARYIRLLLTLPGRLQLNEVHGESHGVPILRFRFDGGEGALMPLRRPLETHIEASTP